MSPWRASRSPSPGFTLVEIAVVLFIVGVLIAMAAAVTRGVSAAQKRSLTATKMATVDAALVQFVQQQKRLPCPGNGTLASTDANAGLEANRTLVAGVMQCSNQTGGVLPWRALGLSENDATDGWDRRFTYRLQATLGADNAMDMSWCDPAGTGPLLGGVCNNTGACTSTTAGSCTPPNLYLQGKGLEVRNIAGTVLMFPNGNPAGTPPYTGAAYVLISPGETGGGGYLGSGNVGVTTGTDGTEEQKNYANLGLQAYYVDDSLMDTAGATHYDDLVSRPSVLQVVTKAGLGPRTH